MVVRTGSIATKLLRQSRQWIQQFGAKPSIEFWNLASNEFDPTASKLSRSPAQKLPVEAYIDTKWFKQELRELFGRNWTFAGLSSDLKKSGDYVTVTAGNYPLFVVRGNDGRLRAFHNICRHRGTELLESAGQTGKRIICPYHHWTYDLDGKLNAVPMQKQCFPDLDRSDYSLHSASLGEFKGMLLVHPEPDANFTEWLGRLEEIAWPHEFSRLCEIAEMQYEIRCNWKVFYENAIDGYHLQYLHRNSLGGPRADRNKWEVHGSHLVWYSTETGRKKCLPEALSKTITQWGGPIIKDARSQEYGGVYMLFPSTIITADPTEISVSRLIPVSSNFCHLKVRTWRSCESVSPNSGVTDDLKDLPGFDSDTGMYRLDSLDEHPLGTGDFQWEDIWICEKLQRSMNSPAFSFGPMASGSGAESPIEFFQQMVLNNLSDTDI